jgi:D-sedoheptulose 7-phosphate isomerase
VKPKSSHTFSEESIGNYISQSATVIFDMENQLDTIQKIISLTLATLKRGNKLLTCGNGGSAAEAMHLAEELTGRYNKPRRALPAICLSSDASAMTCIANDWDFTYVFSRQVEAYAQKNDLLIMFTTSGNSTNCIRAANAMKSAGGKIVGLLGKGGGKAKSLCDLALVINSKHTNHIQEAHQVVLHLLLEAIDAEFA